MRHSSSILLGLILFCAAGRPAMAEDFWSFLNALGRWQGVGHSEGYHACRSGDCHPTPHFHDVHHYGNAAANNCQLHRHVRQMDRLHGTSALFPVGTPTQVPRPLDASAPSSQPEPSEWKGPAPDNSEELVPSPSDKPTALTPPRGPHLSLRPVATLQSPRPRKTQAIPRHGRTPLVADAAAASALAQ